MRLYKYTEQELREAVKFSTSIRQTLTKLNIAPAGGNYATFHKAVKHFDIDTTHFTGQLWNKGRKLGTKRPIQDYLSNKQSIQSFKLKNRLLKEGIFDATCQSCGFFTWQDNPIPLELHHIDGNSQNNSLSNLSLLCPNCHAQTDNYRAKNKNGDSGSRTRIP